MCDDTHTHTHRCLLTASFQTLVETFIGRNWFTRGTSALCFAHDHLLSAACTCDHYFFFLFCEEPERRTDALFSEKQRKDTHLCIARLLRERAHEPPADEELFAMAQHFNKAGDLLPASECFAVAALNLSVSERARARASYATAYVRGCFPHSPTHSPSRS